jgi:hypothetical protein
MEELQRQVYGGVRKARKVFPDNDSESWNEDYGEVK